MIKHPLIPAKAGTQMEKHRRVFDWDLCFIPSTTLMIWVPAFAGMSGF